MRHASQGYTIVYKQQQQQEYPISSSSNKQQYCVASTLGVDLTLFVKKAVKPSHKQQQKGINLIYFVKSSRKMTCFAQKFDFICQLRA